jgi:hypothetical protein
LRETHQLSCFLQLHEAAAPQTVEAFRAEIARTNDGLRAEPLTPGIVQLLGLGPVLSRLPRPMRRARREPGTVVPGDRFFTLRVADDPTKDDGAAVHTEVPARAPVAGPNVASGVPAVVASARRTSIPEQYQKPWEFHLSREEALYDMNVATTFAGPFRRLWRGLKRLFGGRRALRRWQALLCGKNAEEQLWGVRPPRGSLDRAAVREWARRTLEFAGYDPGVMLAEWEIFWRRKGV